MKTDKLFHKKLIWIILNITLKKGGVLLETTYKSLMEKCSEINDDFIMLEEVVDNEGLYYHVIINGWAKFDSEKFEEAKEFYEKNVNKIV